MVPGQALVDDEEAPRHVTRGDSRLGVNLNRRRGRLAPAVAVVTVTRRRTVSLPYRYGEIRPAGGPPARVLLVRVTLTAPAEPQH